MTSSSPKRVLIVGAGCSGLAAIKACLEEDQIPVCLEKTLDIGGLWNYSDKPAAPNTAGIYNSLVINTCKEMMAFSDFPVPENLPQFLTHKNVLHYFRLYARHFRLLDYVRFNTEVRQIRKADDYETTGRWSVTYVTHVRESCVMKCDNVQESCGSKSEKQKFGKDKQSADFGNDAHERKGNESSNDQEKNKDEKKSREAEVTHDACRVVAEVYDGVMVCTGHHTVPYTPNFPGMEEFEGTLLHSHDYKRPESFAGKTVVVLGIGNSAVDIAADLAKTAKKVFLSTRRGSWIVPRTALWGLPADMLANSRVTFSLPNKLLEWCVERQANLRMDHDKLGLTPKHGLLGAHPTINDEIPFHLLNGRVEVRPNVVQIHKRSVQFQDGTVQEADVIILATGYDYRLDFVDPDVIQVRDNRVRLFQYVFPPHLPHATLAVIGLVQPVGAVMPISEIQSRWFVNLLLGRVHLPERKVMDADIDMKLRDMDGRYYSSRRHTLQTYWIAYMDVVATQIGARPDLRRLFFKDPELALKCYFGPCLPAQYRLQGPRPWPHAARFIKDTMARTFKRPQNVRDPSRQPDDPWSRDQHPGTARPEAARPSPGQREAGAVPRSSRIDGRSVSRADAGSEVGRNSKEQYLPTSSSSSWRWSRASVVYLAYVVLVCACCALWVGGSLWGQAENFVSVVDGSAELGKKLKPHCYGNPCF
nr:hypothetical protein BaRGS_005154 [Batillaria attramentaria]